MAMQMIIIRHAATEYNEKELINGSIDEPLSKKGLGQIPDSIASVKQYDFNVIYASPLKRSVQTAEPVAKHYALPLRVDGRLTEVNLGTFEGQGWDSTIPVLGLNSSGVLSSCEYDFRPYGGESSDEVRARLQSFMDELKTKPDERPLIICHGGVMRMFYYLCTGQRTGRVPYSTVYVLTI